MALRPAETIEPFSRRQVQRRTWVAVGALTLLALQIAWWSTADETWREDGSRKADSMTWVLSMSLANSALVLTAVVLCVGPVRTLRTGRRPPPHLPVRRTIGLWAGVLAVAHAPLAVELHTPGWRLWHPFVTGRPTAADPFPLRTDSFAIAYWLGTLAVAVMLVLLATSNAAAMRRFGIATWKRIQRSIYVLAALVVAHALYVQSFEARAITPRVLLWICVAAVVTARGSALVAARRAVASVVAADDGSPDGRP